MKSRIWTRSLAVLSVALVSGLGAGRVAEAQGITTTPLGDLLVIPAHHHQLYFFNVPTPTSGHFWAIQLNNSGDNCPETLLLPTWIDCGPGGDVLDLGAGVATGTITARPLGRGWFLYQFSIRVQGAGTQIWDVGQRRKVAQGYTGLSLGVAYQLSTDLSHVSDYIRSVLGPKAHEKDLNQQGIFIKNFALTVRGSGSGTTTPTPGVPASWQFASTFLSAGGISAGTFSLSPP